MRIKVNTCLLLQKRDGNDDNAGRRTQLPEGRILQSFRLLKKRDTTALREGVLLGVESIQRKDAPPLCSRLISCVTEDIPPWNREFFMRHSGPL